jgi:hypothetical protein
VGFVPRIPAEVTFRMFRGLGYLILITLMVVAFSFSSYTLWSGWWEPCGGKRKSIVELIRRLALSGGEKENSSRYGP